MKNGIMSSKQDKNKKYEIPEKHVRGKKRMRGQPILHEQVKVKLNLTLTPLAVEYITTSAEEKAFQGQS